MIQTHRGLPNSCAKCGEEIKEKTWFAKHEDAARSGQGLCHGCALPGSTDESGDDLTALNGIGETIAKRLAKAGITTFQGLVEADPNEVADVAKTQTAVVLNWQTEAVTKVS